MKTGLWRVLAVALAVVMVIGAFVGCTPTAEKPEEVVKQLPRDQTLYYAGLQWDPVKGWNPYSADMNNALAIGEAASSRTVTWETLYMYNMLDGKMYPLLADGDYTWNADLTQMTIKIKSAAKWNDGTALTAEDVAYTFASHVKYSTVRGAEYSAFIDKIEAKDASTVIIHAKTNNEGKPVNPLKIIEYIGKTYVIQKKFTERLEEIAGGDADKFKNELFADGKVAFSGPYGPYYADDQKVVMIRNDKYWGKDASMWGKLPAPKYLAHTIYADNPAGQVALSKGEVDVCQQFIANIQDMWLKDKLPISTYMDEAPYGICTSIPTAWYNLKSHGLDNVAVRKAIAMAVDYDAIIANAMTGQSPTFTEVPRSMMVPTPGEQASFDHDAVKDLQWAGNDIEGAKKLLDEAGIVDSDGDGWRDIAGKKLSYNACAPNGWTDWQAAMEIVAAAGEKIGIEITTYFPEWSVYQTVFVDGNQTEFDIFMMWNDAAGPTEPWSRIRNFMSSEFAGITGNWNGNYGGYINPEVDEIIKKIPLETDAAKLKELYTEAVKIYLTDVPSFGLMYRPELFHAVNESVWTSYPEDGDGKNIPPLILINGYGIAGLFEIELVK